MKEKHPFCTLTGSLPYLPQTVDHSPSILTVKMSKQPTAPFFSLLLRLSQSLFFIDILRFIFTVSSAPVSGIGKIIIYSVSLFFSPTPSLPVPSRYESIRIPLHPSSIHLYSTGKNFWGFRYCSMGLLVSFAIIHTNWHTRLLFWFFLPLCVIYFLLFFPQCIIGISGIYLGLLKTF